MIYAAIAIHFLLAFINYSLNRSVFHPNFLFTLVWGFSLLGLALLGDVFYELSGLSLFIFSMGALFFSIGGILGKMLVPQLRVPVPQYTEKTKRKYEKLLNYSIIALLLIFPFYIKKISDLSALSGLDEFWKGLRLQTSGGGSDEENLGIFAYFGAVANFLALIACNEWLNGRFKKRNAIVLISLVFVYGVISTARIGVMTLLFALISIFSLNKQISFKQAIFSTLLFLIIFILPAVILDKGASIDNSLAENFTSILENFQVYVLAGIVAFSEITKDISSAPENNGIFAFFLSVMRSIGMDVEIKPAILSYVSTPLPTNVYTIYLQYYSQFGILGVVVIMTMMGAVVSLFFEFAIRRMPEFVILNAVGASFVLISIFSEPFFTALSYWLQLSLFIFLFYRVMPFIRFGHYGARA
jgi:oligosaccharide repeat unit polymerase